MNESLDVWQEFGKRGGSQGGFFSKPLLRDNLGEGTCMSDEKRHFWTSWGESLSCRIDGALDT